MFEFLRRKTRKDTGKLRYDAVRLLYFNGPVDETIALMIDQENKELELDWGGTCYAMSLERLRVWYYQDLYGSFLAQGMEMFGKDWQVMKALLLREKQTREARGSLRNRDGLKLTYQAKDGSRITCLITSEVFLYMNGIFRKLRECTEDMGVDERRRIEL